MNVLFISNTRNSSKPYQDSSVRYRCFNPAQALSTVGITADVTTLSSVTVNTIDRYDIVVFHRPGISKKLVKLVDRATQRKSCVVADFDDLIFNPEYAEQSPGFLNRQFRLDSMKASYQKRYDALTLFDHFTVSTLPLRDEIRKIKGDSDVHVMHNYLSKAWVVNAGQGIPAKNQKIRRITYLPGTNSHNNDFALIENVLRRFLAKNNNVLLRIVGPLRFKKKKFPRRQLERIPSVPYPLLPNFIKDSWVTIAPLADTAFNNCKSGLKYFESAAFGVPVIASPIADMQRLQSKALHLADTPSQWIRSLRRLSDNKYYDNCIASGITHVKNSCIGSGELYKNIILKFT